MDGCCRRLNARPVVIVLGVLAGGLDLRKIVTLAFVLCHLVVRRVLAGHVNLLEIVTLAFVLCRLVVCGALAGRLNLLKTGTLASMLCRLVVRRALADCITQHTVVLGVLAYCANLVPVVGFLGLINGYLDLVFLTQQT
jgi:hypothetical protein